MKRVSLLCMVLFFGMSASAMKRNKKEEISVTEYKNGFGDRCIEALMGLCSLMKFTRKNTFHYIEGMDADHRNSSKAKALAVLKKAILDYEEKHPRE